MAATDVKKWAIEMKMVEENFRILLDKASSLQAPVLERDAQIFLRRKRQLVCSMIFYTTRIISDGIRLVMESRNKNVFSTTFNAVQQLQIDALRLGNYHTITAMCQQFDQEDLAGPNPLVIFLKMDRDRGGNRSNLNDIRNLIRSLELKSRLSRGKKYTPGMPACIMALHNPGHNLIISSTRDRYDDNEALEAASKQLWEGQLQRLRTLCSGENDTCIQSLQDLSRDFIEKVGNRVGSAVNPSDQTLRAFLEQRAGDANQHQIRLTADNGVLASWKPSGEYFASCMLDYYRFHTRRPPQNKEPMHVVCGAATCAEWFGFIELASTGRPITRRRLPRELPPAPTGTIQRNRPWSYFE